MEVRGRPGALAVALVRQPVAPQGERERDVPRTAARELPGEWPAAPERAALD